MSTSISSKMKWRKFTGVHCSIILNERINIMEENAVKIVASLHSLSEADIQKRSSVEYFWILLYLKKEWEIIQKISMTRTAFTFTFYN